jgi:hypothetical protein
MTLISILVIVSLFYYLCVSRMKGSGMLSYCVPPRLPSFYINIFPSFKIITLQYLPLCYEYLARRQCSALLPRTVTKKHGVPPHTT